MQLKDEQINEKILMENQKLYEEMEEKERIEEMREKKIYNFFSKIQRLKNKNNEQEINSFIEEQIDKNKKYLKQRDEGRINFFIQELNHQRINSNLATTIKNKRLGFLSPIVFAS